MHNMTKKVTISFDNETIELPLIVGSEGERAIDISSLRAKTGLITLDSGYANTASCLSSITFIDGEKSILNYRGYPIKMLAEGYDFISIAWLLIFGELPTTEERSSFRKILTKEELLHENLLHHFKAFPDYGHPMAMLSAVVNSMGCYDQTLLEAGHPKDFLLSASIIISKIRTIAACTYRKSMGLPLNYPNPAHSYSANFLHMMFSLPHKEHVPNPDAVKALDLFFLLHADHEQNCSCSTVRMVGSSNASIFASVSAGISALWGPLHGGANAAVIEMLESIQNGEHTIDELLELVKQKKKKLMGFGHRVYKNIDPRANLLKTAAENLLEKLKIADPLLDIAMELYEKATKDSYCIEKNLHPNVDFYSGIVLRALNIPVNMFPVMFAIGRTPGWIAHWHEGQLNDKKIQRPRQVYVGETLRSL